MKWKTFYEILNLRNCATEEEVRRAFSQIVESLENDHLTYFLMSEEEKKTILYQVRLAYEILTDERSKKLYDEYLIKSRQGFLSMELIQKKKTEHKGKREAPLSPGSFLKKIREEKGYTLEDVYYATRIAVNVLKAIEEMKITQLPEWIYLRGLLKQYARFLGIDDEEIISQYKAHIEEAIS